MNGRTHEIEHTETVPISDERGRVVRASVGFSRRPRFDGRIPGHFGRKKRWEYWAVTSPTHVFSLTLAHLDFVGLASAWLVDLRTGERFEWDLPVPPWRMPRFPDRVGGGDMTLSLPGFHAAIRESGGATTLEARFSAGRKRIAARFVVDDPPTHESLTVLVPFSDERFQLTSKHVGRPARGVVTVDGQPIVFGTDTPAYGFLDHGRGVFPHVTRWNWSASYGRSGGHHVGWNLGGQWTHGTGVTENGVFVDGRLDKLGDPAFFEFDETRPTRPWRIHTPESKAVDVELTPLHVKVQDGLVAPVGARIWLAFGTFRGTVVGPDGTRHAIDGHVGWAEEFHARW